MAASGRADFAYALEKYQFSLSLDSATRHSFAPSHGQVFFSSSAEYSYHVTAAHAVIAAFSVIEELGLELRSSQKRIRFLPDGSWNPVVADDLETRLRAIRLSTTTEFFWLFRGPEGPLESALKPQLGQAAPWADGSIVRDRQMTLLDAIHYASWVRNFVAAHKFGGLARHLGPYDVFNVQDLSRRLLVNALEVDSLVFAEREVRER